MPTAASSSDVLHLRGFVTTFDAITGLSRDELEDALGFRPGALATGYRIYALAGPVRCGEFTWMDRTTYSGGWHWDATIGEYVQRSDELRFHLYQQSGFDADASQAAEDRFIAEHTRRLNERAGPRRIVKVLPNVRLRGAPGDFPDSPERHVPQWELRVPKPFRLIDDVPAA